MCLPGISVLLLIFCTEISSSFSYVNNIADHNRMPPLHKVDDYDACLKSEDGTYCLVFGEVIPNATSTVWQQIANHSSNTNNFRYDYLYFGVCMAHCQNLIDSYNLKQLEHSKIVNNEIVNFLNRVHKDESDGNKLHEAAIESCLNYDFQQQYNLKLRTNILYCEKKDVPFKEDAMDFIAFTLFTITGVLIIFCSFYDYYLKQDHQNQSPLELETHFYKSDLNSKAQKILTSFSVCRNYYRLTKSPKTELGMDLSFFETFRAFAMSMVIFAHTILLVENIQIDNTDLIESSFRTDNLFLVRNATCIVHVFFVMTAFLLYINFNDKKHITPKTSFLKCIGVFFKTCLHRYLRLVPSVIYVVLFQATILTHLQDGPYWKHITGPERTFCHDYWWKNIFFINNFFMKETCLFQTWFLAADMQLFIVFCIVLIIMAKYPKVKYYLLATILLIAIIIPIAITIYYNLDAMYHGRPELYRHLFFIDDSFNMTYIPSYVNMSGYVAGIIGANIYLSLKREKRIKQCQGILNHEISFWVIFSIFIISIIIIGKIMEENFGKPTVGLALISGLFRAFWGFLCVAIMLPMCFRAKWVAYKFSTSKLFRPFGKISYQTYLWHLTFMRLILGSFRQPIYLNFTINFSLYIAVYVFTNVFAFIMAIFVEYPFMTLVNACFSRRPDPQAKINCNENLILHPTHVTSSHTKL